MIDFSGDRASLGRLTLAFLAPYSVSPKVDKSPFQSSPGFLSGDIISERR